MPRQQTPIRVPLPQFFPQAGPSPTGELLQGLGASGNQIFQMFLQQQQLAQRERELDLAEREQKIREREQKARDEARTAQDAAARGRIEQEAGANFAQPGGLPFGPGGVPLPPPGAPGPASQLPPGPAIPGFPGGVQTPTAAQGQLVPPGVNLAQPGVASALRSQLLEERQADAQIRSLEASARASEARAVVTEKEAAAFEAREARDIELFHLQSQLMEMQHAQAQEGLEVSRAERRELERGAIERARDRARQRQSEVSQAATRLGIQPGDLWRAQGYETAPGLAELTNEELDFSRSAAGLADNPGQFLEVSEQRQQRRLATMLGLGEAQMQEIETKLREQGAQATVDEMLADRRLSESERASIFTYVLMRRPDAGVKMPKAQGRALGRALKAALKQLDPARFDAIGFGAAGPAGQP